MNFNDFDFENNDNDDRIEFLSELSNMLEYLKPPLIDYEKFDIMSGTDNYGEYFKVIIPHKNNNTVNLCVSVYFTEIIVFISGEHMHFEHYEKNEEKMIEAICFISEILLGKMEICNYYKGDKLIKVKVYYINEQNKKELISTSNYSNISIFNPFFKNRVENIRISYTNLHLKCL